MTSTDIDRLALTQAERDDLRALADRLTRTEPRRVDERAWVDAARALSCAAPRRLRERLRAFRTDPGTDGLLLISGLPVDAASLPPTPSVPGSVERTATVAAAVQALLTLQLGEIIAFRNEKSGALVQNVVPVPGRETSQSNAGAEVLEMHIENAFHPHRPDFVALFCLRNDHEDKAGLRVGSIRRAAALLTDDDRKVLSEERFVTEPPPSFGDMAGAAVPHAVLTGAWDDPDVRVDFLSTHPRDDGARAAIRALQDAFTEVTRTLVLRTGEMALLDNRLAIHGRTAFTPRYDGNDRWLYRTFVHLDHRRSRALRAENGNVLA
ncbi:clavaminate synthase [Actinomadura sp. KC06]|uniref:TauD/TfdA family dioxygenase n=1 Tax=Actinomadura sp. KC06 TaxID=2530369 RepID=UPI001044DD09|nr:TauD/TfdA family dioxygenase [Actinomadura sp. KC06]TDD40124.1 clavaminate synthase [Actinomadura sp. KC06]